MLNAAMWNVRGLNKRDHQLAVKDIVAGVQESVAITVIYGATEVANRRQLWSSLENIAVQNVDVPWLIGGDFNAVRDLSEICGASGDI
ncbi:UNVERIFIED_CONTAM: hypothetical protein Sindi_2649400 [Sesamum indicum]